MTAVLEQHTVLPPADPSTALAKLDAVLSRAQPRHAELVGPDGIRVALPEEIYQVLHQVVAALSQGMAITVAPHTTLLTTQQAADMLGISRPTLVKYLEEGRIPFELRGRHRRVLLADLLSYQQNARTRRRAALDEMTRDAEADGLTNIPDRIVQTR
jgi:excisionase family DNA binding protein